jgi:uncharacterized protein involved in exopolysaccharide biosynthesis
MNTSTAIPGLLQWLALARKYPLRWIVPAVLVASAALAFSLVCPGNWQASQALIIRNEATAGHEELGSFDRADDMKTVQETILELVKSRGVLRGALVKVGPPADYDKPADAWPSELDVAALRDAVTLEPPKGAEFGMTEVFYLTVKNHARERAIALAAALTDQAEARFQKIRDAKARSMISELTNSVTLARADLDKSTDKLSAIEKEVGPDLAELRILNDTTTGDSTLRRTVGEIRTELRVARSNHRTSKELLTLLKHAQHDQGQLLAAPNQLLDSQPALRRLKDGLVDAQINTAQLKGRMSDEHPLVKAARESEEEIGRHLHQELAIAIRGVNAELRLTGDRVSLLEERLAETTGRLERLAELRAPYANKVSELAHRTQVLQQSEQRLSQARAEQGAAAQASLISRIDTPDAGTRPLGPGRAVICLAGIVGGLLVGMGVLFMTVTPPAPVSKETVPQSAPAVTETISVPPTVEPVIRARQPRHAAVAAAANGRQASLTSALWKLNGNGRGPKA